MTLKAPLQLEHEGSDVLHYYPNGIDALSDRDHEDLVLFDAVLPFFMPLLNELYWSAPEGQRVATIEAFHNQPMDVLHGAIQARRKQLRVQPYLRLQDPYSRPDDLLQ